MFNRFRKRLRKPKEKIRYYREYLGAWGWGVMLAYDTVEAYSRSDARTKPQWSPYVRGDFELITPVKKEHLDMTDEELSKIYGQQEEL